MRKIFMISFLLLSVLVFGEGISMSVNISETTSSNTNANVVDEIANRLEILQNKYCSKLNKLEIKRTEKLIDEIYELLAMLPEDVTVTTKSTTSTPVKQAQSADVNITFDMNDNQTEPEAELVKHKTLTDVELDTQKAMNESEFKQLLANVDDESFADDQTSVLRIAAKSKYFTIDQLGRLLELFSFADDKINIVQIVYPKIVDKDNSHNLLKAFTYSDDKQRVEQIISQ